MTALAWLCWAALFAWGAFGWVRSHYWKNQWGDQSREHARALDQLAATKEAFRVKPPTIELPHYRPRTKAPPDLPLMERIWWDLHEYERTGWWDERIAWRIHPDDAELVSAQLHAWRQSRGDNTAPLGLHIMGTPLLVDPFVARYDAVGSRPRAVVRHLSEEKGPWQFPPRGRGPLREEAPVEPVQRVQAGGGLGPPGEAAPAQAQSIYFCHHGVFPEPCPQCWTGDPAVGETVRPVRDLPAADDLG